MKLDCSHNLRFFPDRNYQVMFFIKHVVIGGSCKSSRPLGDLYFKSKLKRGDYERLRLAEAGEKVDASSCLRLSMLYAYP